MITISMKFFGGFRKCGESIDFTVPTGATVEIVKEKLKEKLGGYSLISDSVLANDSKILRDSDILDSDVELSILPPVCGG